MRAGGGNNAFDVKSFSRSPKKKIAPRSNRERALGGCCFMEFTRRWHLADPH